jgi:hypothetical protein
LEKPVKGPGFSLKSKEAVPKTEVLEQPQVDNQFIYLYLAGSKRVPLIGIFCMKGATKAPGQKIHKYNRLNPALPQAGCAPIFG